MKIQNFIAYDVSMFHFNNGRQVIVGFEPLCGNDETPHYRNIKFFVFVRLPAFDNYDGLIDYCGVVLGYSWKAITCGFIARTLKNILAYTIYIFYFIKIINQLSIEKRRSIN